MNGDKNIEQDVETELETDPSHGGVISTQTKTELEAVLYTAANIDKLVTAQKQIRMALLKLAQPGDWVLFKSEKEEGPGKAELGFAGAMRIGSTLGVDFTNWAASKQIETDKEGVSWYRWEFECDASYRGRVIRVYGRAGSRDKFFGKAYGQWKPIDEIDEGNIKMAGRRAAMKEGVKIHFGLHHMDPIELAKFGIKLENAAGHTFSSAKPTDSSKETNLISEPQLKRMYAIGKGSVVTPEEIKAYLKKQGFDSSKQVTKDKYEAIIEWIRGAKK